jgi:hypothetical protein
VTAACGHVVKFGLCEDRLDKYRAARRKKVTDRRCPACREQAQREEQEAAARRRAERPPAAPERKKPTQPPPGRLPDGSCFEVRFDAAAGTWSGTLTIGSAKFTGTSSGVFRLLSLLDQQYRESLSAPAEGRSNGGVVPG